MLPEGEIVWMTNQSFFSYQVKQFGDNVDMHEVYRDVYVVMNITMVGWKKIGEIRSQEQFQDLGKQATA
jgi:hypothetical protein